MSRLERCLTIDDLMRLARWRVPRCSSTMPIRDPGPRARIVEKLVPTLKRIRFRQRVGVNISGRTHATTMLGEPVAMPLGIAPVGSTGMQSPNGEIKAARAAQRFGIPYTLSTMSICSIEDVASETGKPFWFQLYVMRDRDFGERLIDRAKAAGCPPGPTMDLQILGQRHDIRNGLRAPPKIMPRFYSTSRRPQWRSACSRPAAARLATSSAIGRDRSVAV